jgi:tetratricopeptide (TPR) repeat protein
MDNNQLFLCKHFVKRIASVFLCILLIIAFSGCTGGQTDAIKIAEAYIHGFAKFYEQGNEYTDQGLQIQAQYAYGWAAASVSAMRYCVDCLLYLEGEGNTLEDVVDGRLDNWDEIAAMNYASPYPYYFEGLVYDSQGKNEDARLCYEKALINPDFSSENNEPLMILITMSANELKSVKKKLTELEDKIFSTYEPEEVSYPRRELNFSDKYLRTLARECLAADETDYRGALWHYEVALSVNPFEGDNFVGCALMHLYMGETDKAFFYINEGLFVDPEHDGLNRIADILNEEVLN